MNTHYFQHVPFEGLACIEDWVHEKKHHLTCTRFYNNEVLPELSQVDMLIVLGGPMGFDEDEDFPWLSVERMFIAKMIDLNKPVLGICLGAQLIADAIDGSARHGHSKEIGWFPVHFKPERKTAGLGFIPDELTVFHWHGDTFDIPKGATALASSAEYANQAFLYKNNVLGLQFHFEMNEKAVQNMIGNGADELVKNQWVQTAEEIRNGSKEMDTNIPVMWKIMDYLAGTVK